jgi:hypothetical protein
MVITFTGNGESTEFGLQANSGVFRGAAFFFREGDGIKFMTSISSDELVGNDRRMFSRIVP